MRPELETALRCVIWRSSLLRQHSSLGQHLLGIKFPSEQACRMTALAVWDVVSHYCHQRSDQLMRVLPGSEETKNRVSRLTRILSGMFFLIQQRVEHQFPGFLNLLNSIWFLRQGLYPSVALMVLNMAPVSTVTEQRSVGYSYMSRYGKPSV